MDYKALSDKTLIKLITQADEAALSELYDRYNRLVFTIAVNAVEDQNTAEEIVLDVFTRAWQKAQMYQAERAKVSTWLTRIARNRAIDVLRREAVRPEKWSIAWADVSAEPVVDGHDPETAAVLGWQQQRIRAAMTTLPPEQREVVALAYFKGYTHSEIAQLLAQPLGTVKARIRIGMEKLRVLLRDT